MESLEHINAITLVFAALCIFAIAYRVYGIFLANKVLKLDAGRITPAVRFADGHDYVKTNEFVLYGHHFAAIAAAGPLVGPVLAAQFGYLPGALWILIGCVLGGAVHDMVVLFASVRHKGQSLSAIAQREVGPVTGTVAGIAVLCILILTLAGLSLACISAMSAATERVLIKGNEAVAFGAIDAGCRCYFGYPITPQNEVPESLSSLLPEVGGQFVQAESEVGAINMPSCNRMNTGSSQSIFL